jgi:hypothetical protein
MKTILALLLILAATVAFVACGDDDDDNGDATPTTAESATDGDASPTDGDASPTDGDGEPTASAAPTSAGDACPANPDPADVTEVVIGSPRPGERHNSPLAVNGVAAAFEAVIQLTLLDSSGNVLADQQGMTNEGQTLAPFSETVEFTVSGETIGCLQVYTLSAENGDPMNIAQIPLILTP